MSDMRDGAGWGYATKPPLVGAGTTGEMAEAQEALAGVGIEEPTLAAGALEAARRLARLKPCGSRWDTSEGFHRTWHHLCNRGRGHDGDCRCEFCGLTTPTTATRLAV